MTGSKEIFLEQRELESLLASEEIQNSIEEHFYLEAERPHITTNQTNKNQNEQSKQRLLARRV